MAKSALLLIDEELKDRTYTCMYHGEEIEYTFRTLTVKELLEWQGSLESLDRLQVKLRKSKRSRGTAISKKDREMVLEGYDLLTKLLLALLVNEGDVKWTEDSVFRFLLGVADAEGRDVFDSNIIENMRYHVSGMSKEAQVRLQKKVGDNIEDAEYVDIDGKKKVD